MPLLIAVNFSPVTRENYTMTIPADAPSIYEELFTTDDAAWGGSGLHNEGRLTAQPVMAHDNSETHRCLTVTLPGMSTVIFAPVKRQRRS
jgi:1,4-alpha-glucan branching enzyme